MNALTLTLGTIGALITVVCWASMITGAARIVRTIRLGQPAPDRWRPFFPRFKQMLVEFLAHTRMNKFRTVGWAHWLVMIGFLAGMQFWFEAYGQTFKPEWAWPFIGDQAWFHLGDELLGIATIVGILALIVIRQLNHPRVPARLSRFSGSRFLPAYVIEAIVLSEGIGMVLVKAGVLALEREQGHHYSKWTDFLSGPISELLPANTNMVSVFAFVKLISGAMFLLLVGRNLTWGVAWHRFAAFPNIYFKREGDGTVALGAAKPMMSGGKPVDMESALEDDAEDTVFGAGKFEDFSWKGILDFTTCTECGRCQSQCPAWNTGKPLSPKLLIMSLRDHGYAKAPYLLNSDESAKAESERPLVGGVEANGVIDPEVLWSCTTCGACVEQCPVDIEHVDHIIDMRRYQVLIESDFPSELAGLFKNLENKGNPWGQNAKDRLNWISELDFDVPVFGKAAPNGQSIATFEGYEYLFWVGCAGAYEDRAKKTTKAVAELLATAGVKFMVLGQDETCTGDSARRAGNEFLFQQLAQQNIETLNSVFEGVEQRKRKIVVTCAHCFNALNNEYPQVGGTYEVVHHTQLLNRLVRAKQLVPVAGVSQDVTYHDPCYLGRHNKIYNAPRELMAASGSTLVEMPRHGERSMCCGAGGARMWMEEQLGKRINIDRVDEALDTLGGGNSPSKIATGCPFCRVMLTDGVTARKDGGEVGQGVEVVDVAQLMLDAVTRVEPAELTRNLTVVQTPKPEAEPAKPAPSTPETPQAPEPAKPAAAGGGLAMKGMAKAPGAPKPGGLGLKGAAKAPGAKAPGKPADPEPAADTPAAPAKGLAMKGLAKAPGAKAPGKPAEPQPDAADTPATKPAKGLAMKGLAKAPGAKAPAEPTPPQAESNGEPPAETPPAEAPTDTGAPATDTPAPPQSKPGGLGFKSGAKAPGRKNP
ncbi:MAG: 4Fe-4S dicluster domain-containing protein [Mycobacteriaceae bacterium]|nr:4Fe-4S dicluster domain-containing protein [Mycobacteriaceae bacterium]